MEGTLDAELGLSQRRKQLMHAGRCAAKVRWSWKERARRGTSNSGGKERVKIKIYSAGVISYSAIGVVAWKCVVADEVSRHGELMVEAVTLFTAVAQPQIQICRFG